MGSLALNFTYHIRIPTQIPKKKKKIPNVPLEVKQEMRQLLDQKNKEKMKKVADIEEIRAELRGIMWGCDRHLIDDDEEKEEEEEDVYM